MKKRVFVLVTVLALVGILAGSTGVMANKPPANPVDQWQILIAKVNDIWDILTGSSGLPAVNETLSDIQETLDDIQSTPTVVMETGSGQLEATHQFMAARRTFYYPDVRHVSVSLMAWNPGDVHFDVIVWWDDEDNPGTSYGASLLRLDKDNVAGTVEFDAQHWEILASGDPNYDSSTPNKTVYYQYTVTYPAPAG